MSLAINRTDRAMADLYEAACHIANNNPDAAHRLIVSTEERFMQLAEVPFLGRRVLFKDTRMKDWHCIHIRGFRKYLIFYRVTDNAVQIRRIMHGARNLKRRLVE